jgi:nudix-type nucleoside diphosphatase (YffH/AdpP family)
VTGYITWGVLATGPGLLAALGRVPRWQKTQLPGHALRPDPATSVHVLVASPPDAAEVALVSGLSPDEMQRLAGLEVALGAAEGFSALGLTGQRARSAGAPAAEPPGLALALLTEMLRWQGEANWLALSRRRGALAVVAASALRAAMSAPTDLRHRAGPGDVTVAALRHAYARFFALEERDTGWRRFDGALGAPVTRAVFISGDAVTVLPYDPVRDRVLLIEQYRAGPQARGDAQAWSLEAVAGRIDPGETPEQAARREAVEEAGLVLRDLHFVARYYPSPGAVSEYLYSYVALTDLPDGIAGVFGLEHEAEDIRGHLIGFDRLMDLVQTGEIENAPLILTALWLQRARGAFRQDGCITHPTGSPPQDG